MLERKNKYSFTTDPLVARDILLNQSFFSTLKSWVSCFQKGEMSQTPVSKASLPFQYDPPELPSEGHCFPGRTLLLFLLYLREALLVWCQFATGQPQDQPTFSDSYCSHSFKNFIKNLMQFKLTSYLNAAHMRGESPCLLATSTPALAAR